VARLPILCIFFFCFADCVGLNNFEHSRLDAIGKPIVDIATIRILRIVQVRSAMKKGLVVWLGLVIAAGCSPLQIVTHDRVTMESPIVTTSRIVTDSPPISDGGPVVAMTVGRAPADFHGVNIAVLDMDGLLLNLDFTGPYSLGENPLALFREKLDAIAADAAVAAVVVRINSPGGSVTASDIMWRDLQLFRARTHKPVVACLMDLGTGGAYYLATAADLIVAHPTAVTGGIGVILNLYNLRELMAQYNVVAQEIKAGKNIDMGTSARNLTPDTKQLLQAMADEFHQRFKGVVQKARPALDPNQAEIFDGRVFTAQQALERKLIDRVGYLDDAIKAAQELAHVHQAQVVLFRRHNDPARSPYSISPNVPLQATGLPLSLPGLERSKLPTFLYLWQPEATLEKLSGK
jgi:protease-4